MAHLKVQTIAFGALQASGVLMAHALKFVLEGGASEITYWRPGSLGALTNDLVAEFEKLKVNNVSDALESWKLSEEPSFALAELEGSVTQDTLVINAELLSQDTCVVLELLFASRRRQQFSLAPGQALRLLTVANAGPRDLQAMLGVPVVGTA